MDSEAKVRRKIVLGVQWVLEIQDTLGGGGERERRPRGGGGRKERRPGGGLGV